MSRTPIKVALFSEVNSKLGAPFLGLLATHSLVDLVAVVTSPPGKESPYFVQDGEQVNLEHLANAHGVPTFRPESVNDPVLRETLQDLAPDYFIVGNFQQVLKQPLLDIPRVLPVNFHPSPLPEYAGIAPFYWMIRHGARYSAITALEMDTGLDTGRILMQRKLPMSGRETALELRTRQEQANVDMLNDLIPLLAEEAFTLTPQNRSTRSYFGWPSDHDYTLDFTATAEEVDRAIRAATATPEPCAFGGTERVTILRSDFAGGSRVPPLEAPGTWMRTDDGIYVACADAWLEIVTTDLGGIEIPSRTHPLINRMAKQRHALMSTH